MKPRISGLQLQLIALIILPFFLLLLVIAVLSVRVHKDAMRRLVAERDERSVRAAASAIAERLHHKASTLGQLLIGLESGIAPQRALQQASPLAADFTSGLAILRPNGTLVAASESWTFPPATAGQWARQAAASQAEVSYWGPFAHAGQPNVILARRRGDWVALGAFPSAELLRSLFLMPSRADEALVAILVNQDGELLAGQGDLPSAEQLAAHPGVQAALRGETGSSYLPAEDGEHVVAFSTIQPMGWALVLEEAWTEVASPVLDLSLLAPLTLIPALLLAVAALWFGARQVVQPLRHLEAQAREWAFARHPDRSTEIGGIAEIRRLHQTLRSMSQRIEAAQQALRSYIGAITQAQEEERRRIARELHDETIQHLISLDQRIQMMRLDLERGQPIDPQRLDTLHQQMQRAVHELRRLSRGLRPLYLEDLGLPAALEMLCRDVEAESGIQLHYQSTDELRRLDAARELAIYRIVQEALSNMARHSNARHGSLRVESAAGELAITITDDGVGFDPPDDPASLATEGHYGLLGMFERASQIDARLEIHSAPGKGTRIRLTISFPPPSAS